MAPGFKCRLLGLRLRASGAVDSGPVPAFCCGAVLLILPTADAIAAAAPLRTEYRERLTRAKIRKDRPGKRSTYTLRYFTLDTDTIRLF